jgi:hypothetical protein
VMRARHAVSFFGEYYSDAPRNVFKACEAICALNVSQVAEIPERTEGKETRLAPILEL